MRKSIARLLEFKPKAMYLTHYGAVYHPAKLAQDLLRHISAVTNMAEYVQSLGLDHDTRHMRLKEALQAYIIMQAQMFGSTLSSDQISEIFAGDIELNTQGMTFWQDSLAK